MSIFLRSDTYSHPTSDIRWHWNPDTISLSHTVPNVGEAEDRDVDVLTAVVPSQEIGNSSNFLNSPC